MLTFARLGVFATDDRDHPDTALAKTFRDFDRDDVATARRGHERGIFRLEIEVPQNALGQSAHVLEEHRLPLAVRAHHEIMKAEREFDDRIEPRERSVAR